MSQDNAKVVGHNEESSGETYGVWGEADSTDGFGVGTPDDARIDGFLATTGPWRVDVDGERALDLPGSGAFDVDSTQFTAGTNVVVGHLNTVDSGVVGGTISGGGLYNETDDVLHENVVTDSFGTVGGGYGNRAGDADADPLSALAATVAGGVGNVAGESNATVGGGTNNTANGFRATVSGGKDNEASAGDATVGGGTNNTASNSKATVGGGSNNTATVNRATVAGGYYNDATGLSSTVGGGQHNEAVARFATVAGGGPSDTGDAANTNNVVFDDYGTIGGGGNNQAGSDDGDNTTARYATVGGGYSNEASGHFATVGGGSGNDANDSFATVGGGRDNISSGTDSTVGGGYANDATGQYGTIPGGFGNEANGEASFAVGHGGHADHDGAMVFADSTSLVAASQKADEARFQMEIVAEAGVDDQSARAAKTNVEPVDAEGILKGVRSLDVSSWEYRDGDTGEGDGRRHVGPMAEDFHAAFDIGGSENTISSIDRGGVALAAIQELADRLDAKDDHIDELVAENDALRERLSDVEDQLATVPGSGGSVSADD